MSKRKLLLADDSITIQKVVNLTFADEGIEVVSVGDGDTAMRKFEEFIPDLVMADVNMPGLSGYEMCQIIKNNEETQRIPVILLVGSFEPFDETKAREVGADDYLTKPFQSIRQLVNKVTDLLSQANEIAVEPAGEPLPSEPVAAATTNAAPVHDTFAETLEMPREAFRNDFGDAGMDDEMIETSRAEYFQPPPISGYQSETDASREVAKTQPLTAEDLKPFNFSENRALAEQETSSENSAFETSGQTETGNPAFEEKREDFSAAAPRRDEYSRDEYPEEAEQSSTAAFSPIAEERREIYEETPRETAENEAVATTGGGSWETTSAAESENEYRSFVEKEPQTQSSSDEVQTAATESAQPENFYNEHAFSSPPDFVPSESTEPVAEEPQERFQSTEQASDETERSSYESAAWNESTAPSPFDSTEQPEESTPLRAEEEFEPSGQAEAAEHDERFETARENERFETSAAEPTGENSDAPFSPEAEDLTEPQTPPTENENQTDYSNQTENWSQTDYSRQTEAPPVEDLAERVEETPVAAAREDVRQSDIKTEEKIPVFGFDDGDLLDLPPLVEETGIRPPPKIEQPKPEPEPVEPVETEPAPPTTPTIPPELIETIVQKLAEKISGQVSEVISGQVSEMIAAQMPQIAPQVSELIVEELTKEQEARESQVKEPEGNE